MRAQPSHRKDDEAFVSAVRKTYDRLADKAVRRVGFTLHTANKGDVKWFLDVDGEALADSGKDWVSPRPANGDWEVPGREFDVDLLRARSSASVYW